MTKACTIGSNAPGHCCLSFGQEGGGLLSSKEEEEQEEEGPDGGGTPLPYEDRPQKSHDQKSDHLQTVFHCLSRQQALDSREP